MKVRALLTASPRHRCFNIRQPARCLLLAAAIGWGQLGHGSEFNDAVDALFADIPDGAPGCNVGVARQGEYIHKAGYGLANLELDVPLDGNNVHRMGSVSKQFTALAVLLLADEGAINLNADIRTYLPALRDYSADYPGSTVSVNAVLGHTAGMADYDFISSGSDDEVPDGVNLKDAMGKPFRIGNEDYLTIDEFYEVVKRVRLRHAPNEQWEYSNLGYFLLSMLVEEVSGQSLREFAEQRMFGPLGMTETFFSDDPVEIVKNRAYGYAPAEGGGYVTDMTNLFWVGDGGLHTNLDDMLIWDNYFYTPSLGRDPEALLQQFNTPNTRLPAQENFYANGQFVASTPLGISYLHSGGWLGTTTFYARLPEQEVSVMLMCNDVSQRPSEYYNKIMELYVQHATQG
jgi:CubicO group peptidase (beta-lactamase class C family)